MLRTTFVRKPPTLLPKPADVGLPAAESVRFRATDGLTLAGWKIPSKPAEPWIIICHGFGSHRAANLELATHLHALGFNLFLFDFRAHGESAGVSSSLGLHEQCDLEGALAYLGRQPEIPDKPYGVLGRSMGASVAVLVAARDERISAVVADGLVVDLPAGIARQLWLVHRLPREPFLTFANLLYRLRYGKPAGSISPLKAIHLLAPRPILLITGERDLRTPPDDLRRLAERAAGPKDTWIVNDAAHLETFARAPQEYIQRVGRFFKQHLS